MTKISIVTVVFNGEKYLEKTIISIINQTYKNIEHVVIDGGSTDRTLSIIEKYKSHIDVLVSEPDKGLSDAMNKGSRLATGDWILYLHADDTFTDSMSVQKLIEASIKNTQANWITGYLRFQNSIDVIFREDNWYDITWNRMIIRNVIRHQATIVKLDVFKNIWFSEKFKHAMDYDFFLKLWSDFGDPIIVKAHISDFRLDGTNLSSDYFKSLKDEMRVRIDYRYRKWEYYKLPFDYFVYYLRYFKIVFYHNKNVNG